MDAIQFARQKLESTKYMLEKAYEGMTDKVLDSKICDQAMTPRETAIHLAECYQCVITEAGGGTHEWGSFKAATLDWPALRDELMALRSQAVSACMLEGGDKGAERAYDFVIAHDNYHVGQLCLARLMDDPSWDPYSIYDFG